MSDTDSHSDKIIIIYYQIAGYVKNCIFLITFLLVYIFMSFFSPIQMIYSHSPCMLNMFLPHRQPHDCINCSPSRSLCPLLNELRNDNELLVFRRSLDYAECRE